MNKNGLKFKSALTLRFKTSKNKPLQLKIKVKIGGIEKMRRLTYIQKQKALKTIRAAHKGLETRLLLKAFLTDIKTAHTDATAANLEVSSMAEWFALYIYNNGQRTI